MGNTRCKAKGNAEAGAAPYRQLRQITIATLACSSARCWAALTYPLLP